MQQVSIALATFHALAFATGAALCILMALLQWRSPKITGGPRFLIVLWICGFLWSGGSFVRLVLMLAGFSDEAGIVRLATAVYWMSTASGPVMMFTAANRALGPRMPAPRLFFAETVLAGIALVVCFASTAFGLVKVEVASISSLFAAIGHSLLFGLIYLICSPKGKDRPHRPSLSSFGRLMIGFWAVWLGGTFAGAVTGGHHSLFGMLMQTIGPHWVVPITLLIAATQARTHYADVVLKRGLALIFAIVLAGVVLWQVTALPKGLPLIIATLAAAALMGGAPFLYRGMSLFIDRYLLHRPAYQTIARAYAAEARKVEDEAELLALTERTIGETLRLEASFAGDEGEAVPLPDGRTLHLSPPGRAQGLMQAEHDFLGAVGAELSHRQETLAFDAERRERQRREARLEHAVTEAELKALRAQVDPHFLFNTLNTIADLIEAAPEKAELMTEKLAAFFRYTLNRQDRSVATLDEELDFVRQYLDIEQVRFGDRLKVLIEKEAGLGDERVPSLLLQPLVENALKHGLSSQREGGAIRISARRDHAGLRLEVADDGVGVSSRSKPRVGLSNVRERARAMHGEAASLTLEPGEGGKGTRAVVSLPL